MRMQGVMILVLVMMVSGAHAASAGLLGPASFDECITDSMKGVKSDYAARKIEEACAQRFHRADAPALVPAVQALSPDEAARLSGQAGAVFQGAHYFVGSLYNGNTDRTLKTVTIFLVPKLSAEGTQESEGSSDDVWRPYEQTAPTTVFGEIERKKREIEGQIKYYRLDLEVPPLTTKNFSVQILDSDPSGRGYDWGVVGAEAEGS